MRLIPLAFVVAACGGPVAEAPLRVSLGISHEEADRALRAHQFCRKADGPPTRQLLYPRCERVATEHGDAWVVARFDRDRLVELRRWERYGEDARAVERWNDMVAARSKISAPSDEALAGLKVDGGLPPGTRIAKAFDAGDGTVVGVFLLTPTPPEHAHVLEKISYKKK
jgi:hypothetical protein